MLRGDDLIALEVRFVDPRWRFNLMIRAPRLMATWSQEKKDAEKISALDKILGYQVYTILECLPSLLK